MSPHEGPRKKVLIALAAWAILTLLLLLATLILLTVWFATREPSLLTAAGWTFTPVVPSVIVLMACTG